MMESILKSEITRFSEEIRVVSQIDDHQFLIKHQGRKYYLSFYAMNQFERLVDEQQVLKLLHSMDNRVVPVDDIGEIGSLNKCYKITQQIDDQKQYLSESEKYKLGIEIGHLLSKYHTKFFKWNDTKWAKHYHTKINIILHEYGISEHRGHREYVLLDFINNHNHLLRDRPCTNLLGISSLDNIVIDKNGKIHLQNLETTFGDPILEFYKWNLNNYGNEIFASGIIDGYIRKSQQRLFFKLLAIYSIIETWDKAFIKDRIVYKEIIDLMNEEIIGCYEDFTMVQPTWYQKAKKNIEDEIINW